MRNNRRENDLARALRFVANGEQQIAHQRHLIAELKSKGRSTQRAEALLETLQRSHLQMQNYLRVLQTLRVPDIRVLD